MSRKTLNSSKGTKGKICGRLAVLPSMPLDILLEIFGHLRPIDLLQLSRANKALNKIMMSNSGVSLWKAARRNIPAFPETPGDMSDAEWVHLIFETNCHGPGCKKKGIRKIDWALRIRGCERCWKENVVWSGRFAQQFPELELEVMQLLPYSSTGGWAYRYLSNNQFYWRPAILALSKVLDEYTKNIQLRKPGAEAAVNAFRKVQAARAETAVKYASVCKAWESDAADNRRKTLQILSDDRIHEVSARFMNLGWSSEHVEELKRHNLVRQSKELTERVWVNIRPQLEKELQKRRYNRRRTDICILFEDYLVKNWGDGLRNLFWGIIDMIDIASLKDIVKTDGTHDLSPNELDQCRDLLPAWADEWLEWARKQILAKIPSTVEEPKETPGNSRVELATSTLTCCFGHGPQYWPEIVAHKCFYNLKFPQVVYDPGLSAIIQSVVHAVGLSPDVATPFQLDAHDVRLKCASTESCVTMGGMSWRDAVEHCSTRHDGKASPSWCLDRGVP
ncbi:hypothetical protein BD410DRAFT_783204 [Rickenella mellea]|uniref:F-box domain-containing protein n=1 Tax=Rickenella mellea TaxID=50990 RepID=A0A4Y7QJH9_9AGAM|nr:hypothetical protein BD410DRAFT_783204 [Rickenella mellea]